ncbi:hypothetical protein CGCA056_v011351 [Colletotrichum aenigma]|uniref:uncharacterized protein n=1 Tax=Colletotrichum aenigma TaxID=1215731 RepID=UPI0018732441|nr:uncharacterized protein CGCA056_v011351 [Colletotrichum aenigma]KAF5518207.1 hypothetical protein CGCA056_v011351 [Colletotrichum aenigma]
MRRTEPAWHWMKSLMEQEGAFDMDPRGDLCLLVTPEDGNDDGLDRDHDDDDAASVKSDPSDTSKNGQRFVVCSRALSRASPVFCKMLYGHFAEADSSRSKAVNLNDAIEPMFLALLIIHGRFDIVPARLTVEELFELLVITNKYQMTGIARPWLHKWVPYLKAIPCSPHKDLLAWIAWELGAEQMFGHVAKAIARECRVNEDGEVLDTDGELMRLNIYLDAAGILDGIARARKDAVSSLFSPLRLYTQEILNGKGCTGGWLQNMKCNNTVLGSVMMACKTAGIDPAPLIAGCNPVYLGSVADLYNKIQLMMVENWDGHDCNPIEQAKVLAMNIISIEDMPSPVTQPQREHMKKQKSISGWNRQCN